MSSALSPFLMSIVKREASGVWEGIAAGECSRTSFVKKVAVCTGSFKPERVPVCCVYQDPVGFNMAVARWLPRSNERMISAVRWKWDTLSQKPNDLLQLAQTLSSFPHPLDVSGKLLGLRDLLHFSQFLNIASTDSNF